MLLMDEGTKGEIIANKKRKYLREFGRRLFYAAEI
jgi:hypothetical protein